MECWGGERELACWGRGGVVGPGVGVPAILALLCRQEGVCAGRLRGVCVCVLGLSPC